MATGTVIGELHRRHRSAEFRKFLDTIDNIDNAVPADRDVPLIVDNYGAHKTAAIRRWLTKRPRFHMHFSPTGSSCRNLVERFFAALTEKQSRRDAHRGARKLEAAIRQYLAVIT